MEERDRRTQIYKEALASIRLEGFELDEQVKTLYRRYITGELNISEAKRWSGFGPVGTAEKGEIAGSAGTRREELSIRKIN